MLFPVPFLGDPSLPDLVFCLFLLSSLLLFLLRLGKRKRITFNKNKKKAHLRTLTLKEAKFASQYANAYLTIANQETNNTTCLTLEGGIHLLFQLSENCKFTTQL